MGHNWNVDDTEHDGIVIAGNGMDGNVDILYFIQYTRLKRI